jgi:hypothetical protein
MSSYGLSANLIDTLRSYITPDIISKASSLVGENPAGTGKALSAIVPALLGSATNMASTEGGASKLLGLIQGGGFDGSMLNSLGSLLSGGAITENLMGTGQQLLGNLFGNNANAVSSAVSNFAGVSNSSASSLMKLGAPLVMSLLGKVASTQGLSSSGLAGLLSSEKSSIAAALPAGLGSLPGLGNLLGSAGTSVAGTAAAGAAAGRRWLVPVLLAILVIAGLLWFVRGCNQPTGLMQVKLPNGEVLSLPAGSFNYTLAQYLANGSNAELPKTFVFDHLNFNTGTTDLTPDSRQTVSDLIVILKAYPNAEVQLAGYTDNTGDPVANQKLSQDRAYAIRDMLAAGGVATSRMTAAGYGQDKPVAANDTEEGRAKNRRTELVVTKK